MKNFMDIWSHPSCICGICKQEILPGQGTYSWSPTIQAYMHDTCPKVEQKKVKRMKCIICQRIGFVDNELKEHQVKEHCICGKPNCIDEECPVHPYIKEAKRFSVTYRFDALNWEFLKILAMIASYADEKYERWDNYTDSRLTGDKSPLNHMIEHYRQYMAGEKYDHFDGDTKYHLAAIAYNAMMEFYYHTRWGHLLSPLVIREGEKNESATHCPSGDSGKISS